jgi:hypothetical protein
VLILLPRQKERIQERLLLWGYPSYIVENMEPHSLMSHYNYELKKRALLLAEQNDEPKAAADYEDDTFDVTIDTDKKYKGVNVPYKW